MVFPYRLVIVRVVMCQIVQACLVVAVVHCWDHGLVHLQWGNVQVIQILMQFSMLQIVLHSNGIYDGAVIEKFFRVVQLGRNPGLGRHWTRGYGMGRRQAVDFGLGQLTSHFHY